jgi:hypothetical protein
MLSIRKSVLTALVPAFIAVVGCSDDNPVAATNPPTTAKVVVVHASPNAPAVDILVDNATPAAVTGLAFPTNTGYVDLAAGSRNVKVNVANTTTTVINADLSLSAGKAYSVFAIDSVSSIEPLVLEDDLTAPAAGKAHVRFVHLSPDAPAVDVAVTAGPVVFGNVAFRGFQGFTPLDAGTYNLEVRVAGTATVALPLPGITLAAGKIYTVFARGFLSGAGAQALGAEIIVNQ